MTARPADFTPVCTTEFIGFQKHAETFRAMNGELLGLGVSDPQAPDHCCLAPRPV